MQHVFLVANRKTWKLAFPMLSQMFTHSLLSLAPHRLHLFYRPIACVRICSSTLAQNHSRKDMTTPGRIATPITFGSPSQEDLNRMSSPYKRFRK